MKLIGLLLSLAAITAIVYGNDHDGDAADELTLIPSDPKIIRYTNESLIVSCRSPSPDVKLHWKSPSGEIVKGHKGHIHIEQSSQTDELKLVFVHISLGDRGNWACEDTAGGKSAKVLNLVVIEKITFTENTSIMTVKEGQNATILCEVRGDPQPNITWHFNGQPIIIKVNSTKYCILADGLLINTVTQNDTGEYTCQAIQVSNDASDMQERTILMKIEHKPMWSHHKYKDELYAYINGTAALRCEAVAEPPANFTWQRNNKQIHNDHLYKIEHDKDISILHIRAGDKSVFTSYTCKVKNHLGSITRAYVLFEGDKPPTPHPITLRGLNSNTFDIELSVTRPQDTKPLMEVSGYRIEYMTELEFKKELGLWSKAKFKDFNYDNNNNKKRPDTQAMRNSFLGATFLLNNLEANTTYKVRAASRNVAGLSDWTKIEKLHTQNLPLSTSSSNVATFTHILCFALVALLLSRELTFGLPANVINLLTSTKLYKFVTLNTGRL